MDAPDRQIMRFIQGYNAVARREPNLPGFRTVRADARAFQALSAADQSLLGSAFYLQAREAAARLSRPITEADVRRVLAVDTPRPPVALEQVLRETRMRAAQDPRYEQSLMRFSNDGLPHCVDVDTGWGYSGYMCAMLVSRGIFAMA